MHGLKLLIAVCGLTVLTQPSLKVSAADSISYVGAVVEYYPVTEGTDGTTIANANANNYVTMIKTAWSYHVDIIVFPESSLTSGLQSSNTNRTEYPSFSSIVPDPDTDIPCANATTVVIEALQLISCAAKQYSIYVVVNLHEMENCTTSGTTTRPCPSDGYFFYNTNVVFDRTGRIIARYRKFNLFGEPGFNVTATPDISVFTTDFNVTFGQIICFDLLFKTPTLTLITDYNVTDIVFPTHWFSELPYLTAVQAQSAWSYANDMNFLGSGYNEPATGSGGSGIFAGTSGSLIKLWSENATNALLVARVPKLIDGKRSSISDTTYPLKYTFSDTEITTLVDVQTVGQQVLLLDNLAPYTTSVLELTNGTTKTSLEVCDRKLCCSFEISKTFNSAIANENVNYYRYRIAVFNGVRTHSGVATTGLQICSVISCTNDTVASCGLRFEATDTVVQPTVFHSILITGNFSSDSTMMQMPDSVTMDILPLNTEYFTFIKTDYTDTSITNIAYTLIEETSNLLTFAIYGRNFSGDGLAMTTPDAGSSAFQLPRLSVVTTMLLAAIIILLSMVKA